MKKYRKTIFAMIALLLISTLSIIARDEKREDGFKNLQVYPKDISSDRLLKDMELFSKSLSVGCGYCHAKTADDFDYASDGPGSGHKKEARTMMILTNELNTKYFGATEKEQRNGKGIMNCYTCHRGEEFPMIPWDSANIKSKSLLFNRFGN